MLLAYQQRVVDERDALLVKLRALKEFMLTPTFAAMPANEVYRMSKQAVVMEMYADILNERIAAFPSST